MIDYIFKYKEISESLYDALAEDPFYYTLEKAIQGNSEEKKEAMLKYLDYSMIEGELFGLIFIPEAHNYGVSIWSKPLTDKEAIEKKSRKKEFFLNQLGLHAWIYYKSTVEFMSLKSSSLISSEHWYLSIVGLKPSHQNKGLGSSLISPVLELSDSKGLMTYLETFTPRNIKFYEKLGYEILDSFIEPITKAQYWVMVRKPLNF
jgi:GNAT superfamily N-acetyltransferase